VFLDPPYALLEERRARMLDVVGRLGREQLAPDGLVVLHTARDALAADAVEGVRARVRRYGTNDLWYLEAVRAV
jgi:16S rRNA G966 N2-methylase RsmD